MNCYNHPDNPAAAYCRACGRPLCPLCQRTADGVIYCPEHAPVGASATAAAPPPPPPGAWTAPPPPGFAGDPANPYVAPGVVPIERAVASPGLAFLLGLIPGVGAIYNGQYVKGLVHAAIFGLLITIAQNSSGNPMIGMSAAAFYFYMPFEAYHTARKRQLGAPVEEWSSLMGHKPPASPVPIGPVILILVGVLFLLNSLDLLDMHAVVRFWPVLLIVGGIAMLVARLRGSRASTENVAAGFHAAAASEAARER